MKYTLLVCCAALFALTAWALESPDVIPGDETGLSTGLVDADSLDIYSGAPDEASVGGTRHNKLEQTVFRREAPVAYHAGGRRDPFRALLVDSRKTGEIHTDLLLMEGATLTGVVWSGKDMLAMVKDKDGTLFFLREGDPIYQGRVVEITQTQAVFTVSSFGDYDRITLKVRK